MILQNIFVHLGIDIATMYTVEQGIKDNLKYLGKVCKYLTNNYEDSKTLKSVVLEKIWRYRARFEGDRQNFKAWSYTIAVNSRNDQHRAIKRQNKASIPYEDFHSELQTTFQTTPDDIDNRKLLSDIIYTVEMNFSSLYFEIFRLICLEGLKYIEVSEKLSITPNVAKSNIFRIRNFLSDPKNIISRPVERVA